MINELEDLYKKLKSYKKRLESNERFSEAQKRYTDSLREKLVSKTSALKEIIVELTQKQYYTQFWQVHDIWNEGLNPSGYLPSKLTALGYCIDATNEAIVKLKLDIEKGIRDKEGKLIGKPQKTDIAEPLKTAEEYGGSIVDGKLELIVQGTPDMILECIRSTTEKLNSQGYTYSFRRTSGAPDYARWDKTYFASCAISQGDEGRIGTIGLQLIPDDKTSFKVPQPEDWNPSFKNFLNSLLAEFEKLEFLDFKGEKPAALTESSPKAFIAHGGDSPALRKLKNFLEALGIEPLVVEEQASENRSVGDNVDYYARQADFAIILATKGDIDGQTGGFIPRGNVLIEIGKSQEIFKDRIIYLLQAGTKFPTNISEKVWGRFTTERMDDAFIKIARELTEMKILKAVKPYPEE